MNTKKIEGGLAVVKAVITYRYGEKLLGQRDGTDRTIDLRPIVAAGDFNETEQEALIRELEKYHEEVMAQARHN
jgi:hypothetical protein